jgi:lysophospholipase L1-like esterase
MNPVVPLLLSLQIVFCGDSLTRGFEHYKIFDGQERVYVQGIDSSTSADVLSRIEPIAQRKPQKMFLMIGVNEIGAGQRIVENYEKMIRRVQEVSPYTKIYVQSILPTRVDRINNADIVAVNRKLSDMCKKFNTFVKYLDLYPAFVAEDGKLGPNFTEDGIHLTRNAYSLWKKLIVNQL